MSTKIGIVILCFISTAVVLDLGIIRADLHGNQGTRNLQLEYYMHHVFPWEVVAIPESMGEGVRLPSTIGQPHLPCVGSRKAVVVLFFCGL